MKTSENVDKIFPALIKAQSMVGGAGKSGRGNFGGYANLEAIHKAIGEVMAVNRLGSTLSMNREMATLTLVHDSGQWMEVTLPVDVQTSGRMNAMQAWGSCSTYAQRSLHMAALKVAPSDNPQEPRLDDEGEGCGPTLDEINEANEFNSFCDEWADKIDRLGQLVGWGSGFRSWADQAQEGVRGVISAKGSMVDILTMDWGSSEEILQFLRNRIRQAKVTSGFDNLTKVDPSIIELDKSVGQCRRSIDVIPVCRLIDKIEAIPANGHGGQWAAIQ